jgi:AraC family transcriptional regulator, positive regulator of tynA and feaB
VRWEARGDHTVFADADEVIAVKKFSAASVPPRRRLDYWNELAHITHTPVALQPVDLLSYAPELESARIGDALLGSVTSTASHITHTREHVARTTVPMFFLQLQQEGTSSHIQNGREARLNEGDFTLLDNTRPYHSYCHGRAITLVVGLPASAMRLRLGCPEDLVCVPMSGSLGVSALAAQFFVQLWKQCRSGLQAAAATDLTQALLHLISGSYSTLPRARTPPTDTRLAARLRAVSFIEGHLADGSLTPTKVAAGCGMTPRHLHRIFSDLNQTVGCYIARRRLEECARLLAARLHSGRTVGAIAMGCGFNNVKNFGKTFRARYGLTPTEYRKWSQVRETPEPKPHSP